MSDLLDPYFVLGIIESVSDEQIREAYIRAVRRHPPEQSPEAFARISGAYEQIRTKERRLRFRFIGRFPHRWEEALDMVPHDADPCLPQRREWLAETIQVRAGQAADQPSTKNGEAP